MREGELRNMDAELGRHLESGEAACIVERSLEEIDSGVSSSGL